MSTVQPVVLKRVLKAVHLWAIAVGLVISGEYFGWNFGWGVSGTIGFLFATLLVTVMYITFIFSFTELTTSIPQAGGPFAYAHRAFGWWGGMIAGYATLVEFLITPVAIAFALGGYTHFLYPIIPASLVSYCCYGVFVGINFFGIKESAIFSLWITVLAVAELVIYLGIVAPHFSMETFTNNPMPFGWQGVFAALPFAIWFYLAIEGVAMVAEEVENPKKNIPRGYLYGIFTLIILAFSVMIFTGGVAPWPELAHISYPLPAAISIVLGRDSQWTMIFTGLGLFGLIASFHSTIIGYSRQIFALARANYLPDFLGKVNVKFQTPHWALIAGGFVGCAALSMGTTDQVIILAALGAVVMYLVSLFALFALRRKEPFLERPFVVPFYPYFPIVATLLCMVCLVSIVWYNLLLSIYFLIGFVLLSVILGVINKYRSHTEAS